MKKDGTIYLALLQFESSQQWDLVHWGTPVAYSDPSLNEGWCNQINIKLKVKHIIRYKPLTEITNGTKNNSPK